MCEDNPPNTQEEPITVLIVEDNEIARSVACSHLAFFGCEVDTAENGLSAVHKFLQKRYRMVLMDCQMPVMDGFAATGLIRAIEKNTGLLPTPIIALTSEPLQSCQCRGLEAGMTDFLEKPLFQTDAIKLLNRLMQTEQSGSMQAPAHSTNFSAGPTPL